jgi:hypothetical protein
MGGWRCAIQRALVICAAGSFIAVAGASAARAATVVTLDPDPTDAVTGGVAKAFATPGDTITATNPAAGVVTIQVNGAAGDSYSLTFAAPTGQPLVPGTYDGATRYLQVPPAVPGLSVFGDGVGCNADTGSFTIDEATYAMDGTPLTFSASFQQFCDGSAAALDGEVRFNSALAIDAVGVSPGYTIDFGSVAVGDTASRTVTLTNIGTQDVTLADGGISGDTADFSITSDGCSGHLISAGATCDVTVALQPGSASGLEAYADLTLTDSSVHAPRLVHLMGFPFVGPPPNDDIANALPATPLPYLNAVDMTSATASAGDPSCTPDPVTTKPAATVWYRFSPATFGLYQVTTSDAPGPVALCVYSGPPNALKLVTDSGGAGGADQPFAVVAGHPGQPLTILVGTAAPGPSLTFHLERITTPIGYLALDSTAAEFGASADGNALAWTVWYPGIYAFAVAGYADGRTVAVTRKKTDLYTRGFERGHLLLQAVKGKKSDLMLIDPLRHKTLKLPKRVNTKGWDWSGSNSLSGNWLVVEHGEDTKPETLALVNLKTGSSRTIARRKRKKDPVIFGPAVMGTHVAWTRGFRVYETTTARGPVRSIPRPAGALDYNPALLPDGTTVFVRSGSGCGGATVGLWSPGHAARPLFDLPLNTDSGDMDVTIADGVVWLFFDSYSCLRNGPLDDVWAVAIGLAPNGRYLPLHPHGAFPAIRVGSIPAVRTLRRPYSGRSGYGPHRGTGLGAWAGLPHGAQLIELP